MDNYQKLEKMGEGSSRPQALSATPPHHLAWLGTRLPSPTVLLQQASAGHGPRLAGVVLTVAI